MILSAGEKLFSLMRKEKWDLKKQNLTYEYWKKHVKETWQDKMSLYCEEIQKRNMIPLEEGLNTTETGSTLLLPQDFTLMLYFSDHPGIERYIFEIDEFQFIDLFKKIGIIDSEWQHFIAVFESDLRQYTDNQLLIDYWKENGRK